MEPKKKHTLASGNRALRMGGKALEEITGEREAIPQARDVFKDGFRRLGIVDPPKRKYGE